MALTEAQQRNADENRRYWQNREEEALKHYISDEAEYDRHIQAIYANMLDNVQKEIDSFYARYASAEGITLAEAKHRVSKADIAAYERKAERYVRERNFSAQANEEMRLYNAMMRINRLEMLKANIGLETIAGHDELEKYMAGILKGRTMEELERQAGILGKTIRNNAGKANAIVNGSFKNGTFSDRIWQYQDAMREDLGKLLQTGLIQGKNPRALASDLRKYWYGNDPRTGGGARYCMERLMRTELARVQTEAQKQSFQRNGFDKYLFIVNAKCCDVCAELAKKDVGFGKGVFLVEDMMPGDNAPPVHPHCRCSTAAYEDDAEYDAWLDHLANGGTTAEWDAMKVSTSAEKQTGGKRYTASNPRDQRDVQAAKAYREISRKNDIRIITKNTGFTEAEIKQIRRHIFFEKHKKYDSYGMLDADYDMAVAWLRLRSGKFEDRDITLLRHELLESQLEMMYNLTISEAHHMASKTYNWEQQLFDECGEGGEQDGLL